MRLKVGRAGRAWAEEPTMAMDLLIPRPPSGGGPGRRPEAKLFGSFWKHRYGSHPRLPGQALAWRGFCDEGRILGRPSAVLRYGQCSTRLETFRRPARVAGRSYPHPRI